MKIMFQSCYKAEQGLDLGSFECRVDGWGLGSYVLTDFSHVGPINGG